MYWSIARWIISILYKDLSMDWITEVILSQPRIRRGLLYLKESWLDSDEPSIDWAIDLIVDFEILSSPSDWRNQ